MIQLYTTRYLSFRGILKMKAWNGRLCSTELIINIAPGLGLRSYQKQMKTVNSKHEKTCNRISYINKSLGSQDCSVSKELSTLAWQLSFHPGTLIKVEGVTQFNKVVLWYPYAYMLTLTKQANTTSFLFHFRGQRNGSVIKNTHCSSRGHKISS